MDLTLSDIRREWAAPPNLVSYVRLLLTGVLCVTLMQPGVIGWVGFALLVLAVLSDKLDGWMAKRNDGHWVTKWGTFIDPIIDKVLTLTVITVIALHVAGTLQVILVITFVLITVREVAVLCIRSRQPVESAAEAGRFSMLAQSVGVAWMALPLVWGLPVEYVILPLAVGLGASLASGWAYVAEWRKARHVKA